MDEWDEVAWGRSIEPGLRGATWNNSAALIADGYHARTDGLTSLAVVVGAVGVWLGFPLADPIVGLLITVAIFGIVWQSAKAVFTRMLDGVEPGVVDDIRHAAEHVPAVHRVLDVRARWLGHRLSTELDVAIDGHISVGEAGRSWLRSCVNSSAIFPHSRSFMFGSVPSPARSTINSPINTPIIITRPSRLPCAASSRRASSISSRRQARAPEVHCSAAESRHRDGRRDRAAGRPRGKAAAQITGWPRRAIAERGGPGGAT